MFNVRDEIARLTNTPKKTIEDVFWAMEPPLLKTPSEIDAEFGWEPGRAHDITVEYWNAENLYYQKKAEKRAEAKKAKEDKK